MPNLNSARLRDETPHLNDALKRRAQSIINDKSIDAQTRVIIRYGLEINDPWLGELIIDTVDFSLEPQSNNAQISEEKIEALTEMICWAGDEAAAALFVLRGMLENSAHPKLLANTAKHFAFTRCSESNLFGMVDAQVAVVESELLAGMLLS